ncbi:alpha/beta fold hydrolase [Nonomuraea sp. NPDC050153]|uniref:alpha/beta fold hydrolase n=1 Tax=Nonomuraea sp. NPDC050153 TaxID=3364359 RepID=UPI0037883C07
MNTTYKDAPTETVDVGGTSFAYRRLGTQTGAPVIFLNHLTGVLDDWDARIVDGVAARHRAVTLTSSHDNPGGSDRPNR